MAYLVHYFEAGREQTDTLCSRCWKRHAETYVGWKRERVRLADPNIGDGSACSYCGAIREPMGTPAVFPVYNRTGSATGRYMVQDSEGDTGAVFGSRMDAEAWTESD
jgi:DNA-directed RNA polymerase subunit RPC12/RpoP